MCQIALSVADAARSERFYREVFGFLGAGGAQIRGRIASDVMGLPGVDAKCRWLVGRDDFVQLEIFEFKSPAPVKSRADAAPEALGYRRMGLHVADFDGAIERLRRAGSPPLTPPSGPRGERRAFARDPDGVLVELMEDDPGADPARRTPRPACPVALRSVSLCSLDLERSKAFFGGALGMREVARGELRAEATGAALGLGAPGSRRAAVLKAGPVFVEIERYIEPAAGAGREGARLSSDVGVLNIALGFDERAAFRRAQRALLEAGYTMTRAPFDALWYIVAYGLDDQGFSVELLYLHPWFARFSGFSPR